MVSCSVNGCKRRSTTSNVTNHGVSYHTFPTPPAVKEKWIAFCDHNKDWRPTRNSLICSDHFTTNCFKKNTSVKRKLIKGAVPTVKSGQFVKKPHEVRVLTTEEAVPTMRNVQSVEKPREVKILPKEGAVSTVISSVQSVENPHVIKFLLEEGALLTIKNVQFVEKPHEVIFLGEDRAVPTVKKKHNVEKPHEIEFQEVPPAPATSFITESQSNSETTMTQPSITKPVQNLLKEKRMKWQLELRRKKIRRLQEKNRYLNKKIETLQELLNDLLY